MISQKKETIKNKEQKTNTYMNKKMVSIQIHNLQESSILSIYTVLLHEYSEF